MNIRVKISILVVLSAVICDVYGASLLKPASFPQTFDDVPFIDRMRVLADDYQNYDPEYDENGVCIRGCAYYGMKIEDELDAIERATKAANAVINNNYLAPQNHIAPNNPSPVTPSVPQNVPQNVASSVPPKPHVANIPDKPNAPESTQTQYNCGTHNNISPNERYLHNPPINGDLIIVSDFGHRSRPCSACSAEHRGVDLRSVVGTSVFAPANGTAYTFSDANCGNGIRITHSDGFETTYCHLSKQIVKSGEHVDAGCLIGLTGATGMVSGPHLHYAIKYNGTWIDPLFPQNYLGASYRFKQGAISANHLGASLPNRVLPDAD